VQLSFYRCPDYHFFGKTGGSSRALRENTSFLPENRWFLRERFGKTHHFFGKTGGSFGSASGKRIISSGKQVVSSRALAISLRVSSGKYLLSSWPLYGFFESAIRFLSGGYNVSCCRLIAFYRLLTYLPHTCYIPVSYLLRERASIFRF
jgi:hypothetical protein